MKALKTALICRWFFSWRQRQHTCTHSLHHTGAEQKVLTEWWKNHYAASSVISQHHAERTAMLSPLTRGGGPRESGLTPLTNTSATVCVCVCIPVVIITQIRAEPNPHRVFSPQSCPPADCPAQFSPACSSGPAVWAWMGSRAAALTSPPRLADRQMDKALTHAPFFKIPDISNPLFLLSIAHSPN